MIYLKLRQAGQFIPTLMLTARGRPEDVLDGFAAGADDYLPKTFSTRELLARYCVDCHNPVDLTAGLAIDPRSVDAVPAHAEQWEKVVRKLRAQSMPPEDPRPRPEVYAAAATYLETELDALAAKQPVTGDVPAFRRLTRTEYRNAIRDLLAIEIDATELLPADDVAEGFDNIASALQVSPSFIERLNRAVALVRRRDRIARRRLARVLHGARTSLLVGFGLGVFRLLVATPVGGQVGQPEGEYATVDA